MIETVIVGAGPYGLSMAAHFRGRGIPFRIFGRTMDSWLAHMPKGMMLKSDGFASNIYDPDSKFTLKQFCAERGIEYADMGIPVRLETFSEYGLAFRDRMVPELEDKVVTGIERSADGFHVRLDDGEEVKARRVVLAVGITHFEHVPGNLAHLPAQFLSHSYRHHDLSQFKGRSVVVLGAGSSAIDMAGLLRDAEGLLSLRSDLERLANELPAPVDRASLEVNNLLTIGSLIMESALAREESRGAHFRNDFPTRDDAQFARHSVVLRVEEAAGIET